MNNKFLWCNRYNCYCWTVTNATYGYYSCDRKCNECNMSEELE
ncbi:hypothetical protein [Clostridium botulinum]|nr:hypothetical protein [Clostridium botulinum]